MRLQAPNVAVPNFSAALSLANQGSNDLQSVLRGFQNSLAEDRQRKVNTTSNNALLQLGQVKDQAGLQALIGSLDPSQLTGEAASALAKGQSSILGLDSKRAQIEASRASTAHFTGQENRANTKFDRQEQVNDFYAQHGDTFEQAEYLRSINKTDEARALIDGLDFSGAGFTRKDLTTQREANDSIDNRRINRNNSVDSNQRAEDANIRNAETHNQQLREDRYGFNRRKITDGRADDSIIRGEDAFNLAVNEAQQYGSQQEAANSIANNANFSVETRKLALGQLPGIFTGTQDPTNPVLSELDQAGFVNDQVAAQQIAAENASDPTIRFSQRAQQISESGDVAGALVERLGEGSRFNRYGDTGAGNFANNVLTPKGKVTKVEMNSRINRVRNKARNAKLQLTDAEIGSALIESGLNIDDAFSFLQSVSGDNNRASAFENIINNSNTVQNASNLQSKFTTNQRLLQNSQLTSSRRQELLREQEVIRARLSQNRN